MSILLGDNFEYKAGKPLDGRLKYDTLANMKAVADATMYEGCLGYCEATGKTYQWKSTNTVDADTGKWREFNSGGGGGGGTSSYPDLTDKPQINGVTLIGNKTSANLSLANAPTVLSQTLSVDSGTGKTPTTVTFSGLPASGNNLIDFFTSNGINYTAITIGNSGSSVVLTYPAQDDAYTVYCRIEGV